MKTKLFITLFAVALLGLLVIGCGDKKEVPSMDTVEDAVTDAQDKVDDMTEKAEELVGQAGDTFATLKTEYMKKTDDLMAGWDTKLDELEGKINNLPRVNKKPLEKPYELLTESQTKMENSYEALKNANADNFEAKKKEFEGAVSNMTERYDNIIDKL